MKTLMRQTSLTAYNNLKPQLGKRELEVYLVIKSFHALYSDWTNREIAEYLELDTCCVTGRTNALVKKKLVFAGCVRECEVTGKRVIAWRAKK